MTAKPFEGWTPGATARVWRLQVERNIVLQEGRRECIDTLRAAGYHGAADMLAELVDEKQVWIDSRPPDEDLALHLTRADAAIAREALAHEATSTTCSDADREAMERVIAAIEAFGIRGCL